MKGKIILTVLIIIITIINIILFKNYIGSKNENIKNKEYISKIEV